MDAFQSAGADSGCGRIDSMRVSSCSARSISFWNLFVHDR
jgi:hypothetical protein